MATTRATSRVSVAVDEAVPAARDEPERRLPPRWRQWQVDAAICGLAAIVLGIGLLRFYPFIADDTFISLRYAQRFMQGHGLTWTNGPRVEGYSNLSWVLLLSGVGKLGVDLVVAVRVLGIAGMLGTIAIVVWWSRSSNRTSVVPGVAAGVGMALTGPIVVWAIGGLEQPLLAVLLAGGTVLVLGQLGAAEPRLSTLLRASLLFGVLCLTRPDGAIVPAVACAFLLVTNWRSSSRWLAPFALGVGPAVCVIGQEIFRLVYYRSWVPNTAYAKVAHSWSRVVEGVHYVTDGHLTLLGLFVPAVAIFVIVLFRPAKVDAGRRQRVLLLALAWAAWSAYVMFIGGDVFPSYRHLAECVVLLALLSVEFWQLFVELRPGRPAVIWGVVGLCLVSLGLGQLLGAPNQRAIKERWEWDCEALGLTLKAEFHAEQPLLAADPAGCAPFYSQLPSLDMLGLNDRYLARHRPPGFGNGEEGHELGSGPYVLSRQPDLVLMCSPYGGGIPCYRSDKELVASPVFQQDYRLVKFFSRTPRHVVSELWVRTASPRIGVRMKNGAVIVPGYLLAGLVSPAWAEIVHNEFAGWIPAANPFIVYDIPLPAGTWHLEVSSTKPAQISIQVSNPATTTLLANGDVRLRVADSVDFDVRAPTESGIRYLTLVPSRS